MTDERTRWVGVDVGTARVGLAITDEGGTIALPRETVSADDAPAAVIDLVEEHDAGVVVGWPLELSGRAGRATQNVEVFLEQLRAEAERRDVELAVEKRDERMTTGLAHSLLDEAEVFGRRRKEVVDQLAAVQILKAFLEERERDG